MKELCIMVCPLWELWSNRHTKHSVLQCSKWHAIKYNHSSQSSNQLNSSVLCFCFCTLTIFSFHTFAWFAGFFDCTLFLPYFYLCCLFKMDGSYVSIAERDTYLRFLRFGQVSFPELICQSFRWFVCHCRLLQREDKRGAFEFRDWKIIYGKDPGVCVAYLGNTTWVRHFSLEHSLLVAVLSDRAVDCLIGSWMNSSNAWPIDWLIKLIILRSIDRLIDRLTTWFLNIFCRVLCSVKVLPKRTNKPNQNRGLSKIELSVSGMSYSKFQPSRQRSVSLWQTVSGLAQAGSLEMSTACLTASGLFESNYANTSNPVFFGRNAWMTRRCAYRGEKR